MKNFIETLRNIWKIDDLRGRIMITLGLILIYRIGSYVVLPGVNLEALETANGEASGLSSLLNLFTGGSFSRASIFSLGIMPYISASIIMQLLGVAVPMIQKMQKDGEHGRKKITQITRYLTIAICLLQAPGYVAAYVAPTARTEAFVPWLAVMILIAGTVFVMWLGERITDKGVGNGISLIIMIGIIAGLPSAFMQELVTRLGAGGGGMVFFLVEMVLFLLVILAAVALVQATRKIPVQFAKRAVGRGQSQLVGSGQRSYIPLKLNAANVMPIIFAQAIMFVPQLFVGGEGEDSAIWIELSNYKSFWYNLVFFLMIIIFTYFYTAITVNPNQMADDLKRNGGFIPGIKPGRATADYIDTILSRITLPGSIFLGLIAILPAFAGTAGVNDGFAQFFGGTSLLIMVGVVIDTLQQVESHLLSRHYDGLMKTGRIKGRGGAAVGGVGQAI